MPTWPPTSGPRATKSAGPVQLPVLHAAAVTGMGADIDAAPVEACGNNRLCFQGEISGGSAGRAGGEDGNGESYFFHFNSNDQKNDGATWGVAPLTAIIARQKFRIV